MTAPSVSWDDGDEDFIRHPDFILAVIPQVEEEISGQYWRCEIRQVFLDIANSQPDFSEAVEITDWLFFV